MGSFPDSHSGYTTRVPPAIHRSLIRDVAWLSEMDGNWLIRPATEEECRACAIPRTRGDFIAHALVIVEPEGVSMFLPATPDRVMEAHDCVIDMTQARLVRHHIFGEVMIGPRPKVVHPDRCRAFYRGAI